jgi:hypothetical protein
LIWPTLIVVAVAFGKRGLNILNILIAVAVVSFAANIVMIRSFREATFYLLRVGFGSWRLEACSRSAKTDSL